MKSVVMTCALATMMLAPAAGSAPSFEAPPQRKIHQLDHERAGQAWYVSTSGERYLVRVGRVGPEGLGDLSAAGRAAVPSAIGWNEIARIERRAPPRIPGSIVGAAVGAAALGYFGAAMGEASSTRGHSYNDRGA
jgi:hypothetical protein